MLIRCQWCGRAAGTKCTATIGGKRKAFHCCDGPSPCWDRTYEAVRAHMPRTWTGIVQSPQGDLFDFLPDEGARE